MSSFKLKGTCLCLSSARPECPKSSNLNPGAPSQVWNEHLPHVRAQCGVHPFQASQTPQNAPHCSNCYCYICDIPAISCTSWGTGQPSCTVQAKLRHTQACLGHPSLHRNCPGAMTQQCKHLHWLQVLLDAARYAAQLNCMLCAMQGTAGGITAMLTQAYQPSAPCVMPSRILRSHPTPRPSLQAAATSLQHPSQGWHRGRQSIQQRAGRQAPHRGAALAAAQYCPCRSQCLPCQRSMPPTMYERPWKHPLVSAAPPVCQGLGQLQQSKRSVPL